MISYLLYRSASVLLRIIPARSAGPLAAVVAACFYAARPGIRRNVGRNYERLGERRRRTWPVFRNFSRAVSDFLRLSHLRREELVSRCVIRGTEHLDGALARGKGAILFGPHLGPWELGGAHLASLGYRINAAALEHPSKRVTRYFSAKRAAWGVVDYPSRIRAPSFLRALARGETVVLLVDRNFSKRGVRARFFGMETLVPGGHVVLALRSGAPLLPCCSYYAEGGRVEGVIGPPVETGDSPRSLEAIVSACLERIEEFVRAHPDQWFAFDHLWREADDA